MDKKTMMENLAREAYERGNFNGTWLYAENGRIVSKGAFGFVDAENRLPMQEDTVFEMASVTKMFTATAIMLLVRRGALTLDSEFTEFFPEFPYQGVKVRHLLTHTSGIPDYDVAEWVAPIWENEKRIPPCSEVLRFIADSGQERLCAPGKEFCYSDIGYTLLANLVEKASGIRFEEFLKKNIFEPAGMKDSGIYHTRRDGRPSDRFARNMVLEGSGSYAPSDVSEDSAGYVCGSDGLNGCDYLYTTVFDMLAWDRALREETVLTREEQRIMFTPGRLNNGEAAGADDEDAGYGFGWGVRNNPDFGLIVCHSGGMPGLQTWFQHFVDTDRVLVILNCRDYSDIRAFSRFWDGLCVIAEDREPEPVISIEDIEVKNPDRSRWESYCGKYEHPEDDFAVDEVFMQDGDLWANALDGEGDPLTFRLYPIGENEFGRKRGMLKLSFGDGCLMFDDHTCKKL